MRLAFRGAGRAPAAAGKVVKVSAGANGAKRLTYRIGPFKVIPGQNEIGNRIIDQKPRVDGFITRIRPDLTYTNGKVPGVDVIHLHHGVWLNLGAEDATSPGFPERFVAAGEEKSIMKLPKGYGYAIRGSDRWLLNHMIHNLTPVPTEVYMTYEIDFIPRSSPRARGIRPVTAIWMGRPEREHLPGLNVEKGAGRKGRYTYPNGEPGAYGEGPRKNEWTVDREGVLVSTAGHLHTGRPLDGPLAPPQGRRHPAGRSAISAWRVPRAGLPSCGRGSRSASATRTTGAGSTTP
jgi:hypothetical protein